MTFKKRIDRFLDKYRPISENLRKDALQALNRVALCAFNPYSPYFDLWAREAGERLWCVCTKDLNAAKQDSRFIYRSCVRDNKQAIEAEAKDVFKVEAGMEVRDSSTIEDIIYTYFWWLSERLSNEGYVTCEQVQRILGVICRYPYKCHNYCPWINLPDGQWS